MIDLEALGVDYLLVNATNQYLLEYAPIQENSCYALTGFSGDTGDALLCKDGSILLFVDGRYHSQADDEVDHTKVEVVKLQLGQEHDDAICESIRPDSVLGIVSKKVSQKRLEYLSALLKVINVRIKLIDDDGFSNSFTKTPSGAEVLALDLAGVSFGEKTKTIQKPALFTNSEEISYLCNLRDFSQEYAVKIDGKLLLLEDSNILFTDTDISTQADYKVKKISEFSDVISGVTKSVYVDKSTVNAYDYSLIKSPASWTSPVKQMKSVKNSTELEHFKHCFEMTDKAMMEIRDYIENTSDISEYDIDNELTKYFRKYGAKSHSFKSIVARNQNSAQAHYMKSSKNEIIKDGDLVLIDCGGYYEGGLATDITRVFVKGNPDKLQKTVYTTVLKMFLAAFNYKVSENKTTGFEIDEYTRQYLEKNNINDFVFSHGLGHGIGICVHENPPNLSKRYMAKVPLKNNMCFTIEPGLYNDTKFGVRLENSCYLENGEIKSFSNMCYEKKLIDYTMLTEQEKIWLSKFRVL